MATLTNTQISVTYVGLLKTSANTVLTSTAQQITDGDGNNSIMFLSTAGVGIGGSPASGKELDVTGNVQVTGDLIVDNITIDGSTITNASGDLTIVNTADDGNVIFQSDDGSGGVETYFFLSGATGGSNPRTIFPDNSRLTMGTGEDLFFVHDATDSTIGNDTGDLIIVNRADDKDIIFQSDNQSGGVETYFFLDGSNGRNRFAKTVFIPDNIEILIGNGDDLNIKHDGTDSIISNNVGDLIIKNNADDKDISFQSDNGSGGTTEYIRLDGSSSLILVSASNGMQFNDNVRIKVGSSTGGDLRIYHDSSDSYIEDQGTGGLYIKGSNFITIQSAGGENMIKAIADGAVELYHDNSKKFETTSTGATILNNLTLGSTSATGLLSLPNNGEINLFNANDDNKFTIRNTGSALNTLSIELNDGTDALTIAGDGDATFAGTLKSNTDFVVQVDADNNTSGSVFKILGGGGSELFRVNEAGQVGIGTTSPGTTLQITSSSPYITLKNSTDEHTSGGAESRIIFEDHADNALGQIEVSHNGTNDNTLGNMIFQTNNSSALVTALTLNSSQNATFAGDVSLADSKKILLGNSSDLEIFHDGSNSIIKDAGAGNLQLNATSFVLNNSADSANMIIAVDGGSVSLYHSGNKKFETSSNGISVTDSTITLGAAGTTGLLQIQQASGTNTSGGSLQLYGGRSTGNAAGGDIQFYVVPAGSAGSSVNSPSQVMHIEASSQNVGIGTTSPAIKLDVDAGASDSVARFTSTDSNARILIADNDDIMYVGTQSNKFYIGPDSSATGNNLIIDSSGNVGIGTTSPSRKIECDFTGSVFGARFTRSDASGSSLIEFANSAGVKSVIGYDAGEDAFKIGTDSANNVIVKQGGDATFAGNISLADSKNLKLGTGQDFELFHSGTESFISNTTGDLTIQNSADDKDIIFKSDDGSGGVTEYFKLDGANSRTLFSKNLKLSDSVYLLVGSGNDLQLLHNGTNSFIINETGDLTIRNTADDRDIIFESDDGSGGTAEYMRIDGSQESIRMKRITKWDDSIKATFGDSTDLQIYHSGSNSFIQDTGTGGLVLLSNQTSINNASNSEDIAKFIADGAVELYHDNSKKFETTSAGATVTGDLGITGALSKGSGSFKIDHPVKPDTHYLYHSFVESPLTDLIYRGKTKLTKGKASVNIDKHFGMTEGTFVALVDDKQVFTTNEDTWDAVRANIEGNELYIECQNKDFDGYVSWLVIGDRKDQHIMEVDWTDDKGKPILEIEKLN